MNPSDTFSVPAFLMRDDSDAFSRIPHDVDRQHLTDREEPHPGPLTGESYAEADYGCAEPAAQALDPASLSAHHPLPVSGPSAAPHAVCGRGQTPADLALFRHLTGYHLDAGGAMWRAMDDCGIRVSAFDRLFTTLAGEAFRYADRDRKTCSSPDRDLSPEDLVMALQPIRRAAAVIGSRGIAAFERLEAAILRLTNEGSPSPQNFAAA